MDEAIPDRGSSRGKAPPAGIGFLLQRAHHRLRDAMLAVLDGTGLHLGHIAILGSLATRGGLTQRQLIEHTGIEKSSMVLFLDALERDGWARRDPHPTDRRAHLVTLTAEGERRLVVIGPKLTATEEKFLGVLSAIEREGLAMSLARLGQARLP
jgi:DNA-binding MarR family transcriptional regulator